MSERKFVKEIGENVRENRKSNIANGYGKIFSEYVIPINIRLKLG